MQRILIIEDNKTLANLMAKKIASELSFEIDTAYSLGEAKLFLKKYKYFLTLLDINLPDAPNGEVVDYVLSSGNHAIVLSGNIDKEFRKKMLQKNIIDYINKSGVNDIYYIIQSIKRLQKNQNHKILVVDDLMMFRKQMQAMLENMFFKVISVAHGEEALNIVTAMPDISLVLTDYNMPVMDGLTLTKEIRKIHDKNELSIIALSGNSDDEVTALFLKSGANDYITKPFSKEEFSCRINNSIEALENIQYITNSLKRDTFTGLYNRRYFYTEVAKEYFHAMNEQESFVLAIADLDNLKELNEKYSNDMGDSGIIAVGDALRSSLAPSDTVARFSGGEFAIAMKNITREEANQKLERIRLAVESLHLRDKNDSPLPLHISIGATSSLEGSFEEMLSQADMLLYNAKQAGKNRVFFE